LAGAVGCAGREIGRERTRIQIHTLEYIYFYTYAHTLPFRDECLRHVFGARDLGCRV